MKVTLIRHTPDPEDLCARAAALCYKSEPKLSIIDHCVSRGHYSILEHASATFLIEDISRITSHQLVRHRIGCSYSQVSQRYTQCTHEQFAYPSEFSEGIKERIDNCVKMSYATYDSLIKDGVPMEEARYVLPEGSMTSLVVTMNFRALIHFFELRCCLRAQREIREMAREMLRLVKEIAPRVFAYAGPPCILGNCRERSCPGEN